MLANDAIFDYALKHMAHRVDFAADTVSTNPTTAARHAVFPMLSPQHSGVSRTALRVAGEATLGFWRDRLKQNGIATGQVVEVDGRLTLFFEDPEGQRLALIDDGGKGSGRNGDTHAASARASDDHHDDKKSDGSKKSDDKGGGRPGSSRHSK